MKNIRFPLLLATLALAASLAAQTKPAADPAKPMADHEAIKTTINRFFEGMQKGDSVLLRSTCTADPVLQTFMADREGKWQVFTEEFSEFVRFVSAPTPDQYREDIIFEAIHAEASLASVWTPYKFYVNGKVSHCGTNSFQLVKMPDGWKIQYILDTRRRKGCE
jgi:hypothetical protein